MSQQRLKGVDKAPDALGIRPFFTPQGIDDVINEEMAGYDLRDTPEFIEDGTQAPTQTPEPKGSIGDDDVIDDGHAAILRQATLNKGKSDMIDPRMAAIQKLLGGGVSQAMPSANSSVPDDGIMQAIMEHLGGARGSAPPAAPGLGTGLPQQLAALSSSGQMQNVSTRYDPDALAYPPGSPDVSESLNMESLGSPDHDPYPGATTDELNMRKGPRGPANTLPPEPSMDTLSQKFASNNDDSMNDGTPDDEALLGDVQNEVFNKGRRAAPTDVSAARRGNDDPVVWEGTYTPTDRDLAYVHEHPSDGVLNSFYMRFPTYTSEDMMMQSMNPYDSPDEYATDDKSWRRANRKRSTRIDQR